MKESIRREIILAAAAAILGAGALAFIAQDAFPQRDLDFACDVSRVVDGDGWYCAGMVAQVRAFGIDAPDFNCRGRAHCREDKPAAHAAREYLKGMIHKRRLQCEGKDFDRYGRVVARCALDGVDIGCALIKAGHAVEWVKFSGGAYRNCRP